MLSKKSVMVLIMNITSDSQNAELNCFLLFPIDLIQRKLEIFNSKLHFKQRKSSTRLIFSSDTFLFIQELVAMVDSLI